MNRNTKANAKPNSPDGPGTALLCHFAFWFGVVFATPVFVAAHNMVDLALPYHSVAGILAMACVLLTALSWSLARLAGPGTQTVLNRLLLALALLSAVQGNMVHELFDYGSFNGERLGIREYGWIFYAEWLGYLLALLLVLGLLFRVRKIPLWLPVLPLLSFALLVAPVLRPGADRLAQADSGSEDIDPSVFAFSSQANLIHLLPDGLQGGVVRQVLEEHPELRAELEGFTLYTNHLGLYQGTAPALYTILTGEPFELEKGHGASRVTEALQEKSYQQVLFDNGYRLDYVPIGAYVCPDYATTCTARPFNDMKARGYFRHRTESTIYSFRLIADLSLFRLLPMFLKEKIYDNGHWLLSDTTMDGSSPWPDPVVREWVDRMTVTDEVPVYKWYHYIGGHIPPHWDENCDYQRDLTRNRENYKQQTRCILGDLARLVARLKEAGIYDQTAIIVSSDHGHNTVPDDLVSPPLNGSLYPNLLGSGRPTLLVKRRNQHGPLEFNTDPTSLVDVAPTALAIAGIDSQKADVSAFAGMARRERYFTPYDIPTLWTGNPIPFVRYRVEGPVNDGSQWVLTEIEPFKPVPQAYDPVNYSQAWGFVYGASLNRNEPDDEASWISGRQLAFVLEVPNPADHPALQLTLLLPEWMKRLDFTVAVNGHSMPQTHHLESKGYEWQVVEIPLEKSRLSSGRNFFSLLFDRTWSPPDMEDWGSAGLLKSIRIVESTE